jgi:hypothetical protein
MAQGTVGHTIERLLKQSPRVSTRDVAREAGVSRQAAQKKLRALVAAGALTVEGRARAARYRQKQPDVRSLWSKVQELAEVMEGVGKVDDPAPVVVTPVVDVSPALALVGTVDDSFRVDDSKPVDDSRAVLEVASAGSIYRLSARLLLSEVTAKQLVLDFNGVMEVSDEFLEEVLAWLAARHAVTLELLHAPENVNRRIQAYATAG